MASTLIARKGDPGPKYLLSELCLLLGQPGGSQDAFPLDAQTQVTLRANQGITLHIGH